jgi:hypothetical protein
LSNLGITVVFTVIAALIAVMAAAARRRRGMRGWRAVNAGMLVFLLQLLAFLGLLVLGLDATVAALGAGVIGTACIGHVPRRPLVRPTGAPIPPAPPPKTASAPPFAVIRPGRSRWSLRG